MLLSPCKSTKPIKSSYQPCKLKNPNTLYKSINKTIPDDIESLTIKRDILDKEILRLKKKLQSVNMVHY
jgi:hypothetical protein